MEKTPEIVKIKNDLLKADLAIRDAFTHRAKIAEGVFELLKANEGNEEECKEILDYFYPEKGMEEYLEDEEGHNNSDTYLGVCFRMQFTPSRFKEEE